MCVASQHRGMRRRISTLKYRSLLLVSFDGLFWCLQVSFTGLFCSSFFCSCFLLVSFVCLFCRSLLTCVLYLSTEVRGDVPARCAQGTHSQKSALQSSYPVNIAVCWLLRYSTKLDRAARKVLCSRKFLQSALQSLYTVNLQVAKTYRMPILKS